MPGKSLGQRLADTEVRIRQLEARRQALAQVLRREERKDRTRRLIQIGGVMSRVGIDTLEKAQALQRVVQRHPEVQEWLQNVVALAAHQQPEKDAPECS